MKNKIHIPDNGVVFLLSCLESLINTRQKQSKSAKSVVCERKTRGSMIT